MEDEFELALGISLASIADGLPSAAVPDHDRAGAILTGGDGALESPVCDRMVLDMNCKSTVCRVEAGASGHRPALENSVELQPEIVVQPPSGVLLDDEAVACVLADLRGWLWGLIETALALVS